MAAQIVSQIGNFVNTTLSASTYSASSFESALKANSIPSHLYAGYDWDSLSIAEKWWAQWVSVDLHTLPASSRLSVRSRRDDTKVFFPLAFLVERIKRSDRLIACVLCTLRASSLPLWCLPQYMCVWSSRAAELKPGAEPLPSLSPGKSAIQSSPLVS